MKKLFLIINLLICSFIVVGCKEKEIEDIGFDDILKQSEDEYIVFFHRDGCSGCESIKPELIKLMQNSKHKVYGYYFEKDGEGNWPQIYSAYTGNNGQGTEGKYFVDGVTKVEDLRIATTPAIIIVKKVEGINTAYYGSQSYSKIKEYIDNYENK